MYGITVDTTLACALDINNFYYDYETRYLNRRRWHWQWCLPSCRVCIEGNRSISKETHLSNLVTTWTSYSLWVSFTVTHTIMMYSCNLIWHDMSPWLTWYGIWLTWHGIWLKLNVSYQHVWLCCVDNQSWWSHYLV